MARTTTSDVDTIIDTSLDSTELQAYIDAATVVVDRISKSSNVPDATLEQIEKFYAAHLSTAQDPRISSQSRETASVDYEDRTTDANNNYLDTAISLDPTGVIAEAEKDTATLQVPDTKGIFNGS